MDLWNCDRHRGEREKEGRERGKIFYDVIDSFPVSLVLHYLRCVEAPEIWPARGFGKRIQSYTLHLKLHNVSGDEGFVKSSNTVTRCDLIILEKLKIMMSSGKELLKLCHHQRGFVFLCLDRNFGTNPTEKGISWNESYHPVTLNAVKLTILPQSSISSRIVVSFWIFLVVSGAPLIILCWQ